MSIGYMGYAKLGGTLMLTTNASVAETREPIISGATRGAGWYHPGKHFYSDDKVQYEGNIDMELINQAAVWTFLKEWAIEARTTSKSVIISPDGFDVFSWTGGGSGVLGSLGGLWCSSLNFATSEGSFVTNSVGVLGVTAPTTAPNSGGYTANKTGLPCGDIPTGNPFAYWNTSATLTGMSSVTALDWNCDLNNNPVVVYACAGSATPGPIAVAMGEIDATASVTFYNINGVAPMADASGTKEFVVTIGTNTITMSACLVDSQGCDLQSGGTVISRGFSLTGLAGYGSCKPPIFMS